MIKKEEIYRLIWDFRGAPSLKTAEHHVIHLKEFAEKEQLVYSNCGLQTISPMHTYAYIDVYESEMIKVRDALKPQRGQIIG